MGFKPVGIIPPIVTPLDAQGNINEPVLRQLVNFLIDHGVHGLFPMGTTGEFYAFDDEAYERIIRIVKEEARGRVPIYAGTNHITTERTIKLIRICETIGVDAISVLTPMFINQSQEELYTFYETIAKSTTLPIVMYNNKPKTNITINPETVQRLAKIDNIVGIKDSTGDMTNTAEYIRLTKDNPNFSVIVGRDTLIYAGLAYGATGAISSCSNVAPEIAVDIYESFIKGDHQKALEAQYRLAPLRIATNMGSFPAVIKEGLNLIGIPVGQCVAPIQPLKPNEKEALIKVLQDLELI